MELKPVGEPIENVLVFNNPEASNPNASRRFISKLDRLQDKNEFKLYVLDNPVNGISLSQTLKDFDINKTLIGVAGGDGTLHHFYNKLIDEGIGPVLTIISGGGSNDTSAQLHPYPWTRRDPKNHLDSPAPYHQPLMIEVRNGDYQKKIAAVSYFSIGLTSLLAKTYNSEAFRKSIEGKSPQLKRIFQGLEIPRHLANSEPFILSDQRGNRVLYDLIFPNGNRMAGGAVQFKGIDLLKPEYGRLEVKNLTVSSIVKNLGKTFLGLYHKYDQNSKQEFMVRSLDDSDLIIQADGEDYPIPSGSIIDIELGKKVIRLVSTRLIIPKEQIVA
ncbi:MAG: hypothetical protein M1554_03470 [Patescibacteria group bacterium]|nr:hypothetical protein [Patescibacteria group bacterium]